MKNSIIYFTFLIYFVGNSQKSEIEQVIYQFFKGFHNKDTLQLSYVIDKNITFHTINSSKELIYQTKKDFYKSLLQIPENITFKEEIFDLEIKNDNNIAQVWVPYQFYLNSQKSHQGINCFILFFDKYKKWKIASITDTRIKN